MGTTGYEAREAAEILLVDDEKSLCSVIGLILMQAGYGVRCANDGTTALKLYVQKRPDLVVLDVMMPGIDGFELCARIRGMDPDVPILFLSAKGDAVDRKSGLRQGADDYMAKPFDEEELLLRIAALLRRRGSAGGGPSAGAHHARLMESVAVGDLVIDPRRHEVAVAGRVVALTPREFQILALLAEAPGEVFTNDELVKSLWGDGYDASSVSLAVYVRRIRRKIESDPSDPHYLQTVWGVGYRLGC